MQQIKFISYLTMLVAGFMLTWLPIAASAEEITVRAAVEKQDVFVGESFLLQIQVDGDDSPAEPDMNGLSDFAVQSRGGRRNSSESITIINGRMEKISRHGYIFNYTLTPKRAGNLSIPAIAVNVANHTYQTRPITIFVKKPAETDDFKLRLHLSKKECYIGEPVPLTVTWYISKDVNGFEFSLPYMDDQRFTVASKPVDLPAGRQNEYVTIPLGQSEAMAKKGRGNLDSRQYTTVSFDQILIPGQSGKITVPQATVKCEALSGFRQDRRRDPFEGFFSDDFFGHNRREFYSTVITPSNEPILTVKPLPEKGKPANFNGLVGEYSIATQAEPTEVNIGDPITLTIMITGPEFLDNVELPLLSRQPGLTENFKIPSEMAPGDIQGHAKVFTQTIRAKDPDVKEIPALQLSFFNTETGKYATTRSAPIPLSVKSTRVITAHDAEGGKTTAEPVKQKISSLDQGIAHNYEDASLLEKQLPVHTYWQITPGWLAFLALPPGLFLLMFTTVTVIRKRRDDPAGLAARKAFADFRNALKKIGKTADQHQAHVNLAEAVRIYLGRKMRLTAASITYGDVEKRLSDAGVNGDILSSLKTVLDRCEAYRFGGAGLEPGDLEQTLELARNTINKLEKKLF